MSDAIDIQAILATTPLGVAVVDPSTGRFRWANPALCQMLGRDLDDLTRRTWNELSNPSSAIESEHLASELSRGEREMFRQRKLYLRPDGSTVAADITVASQRDACGTEESRVVVLSPIATDESVGAMVGLLAESVGGDTFTRALAHRMLARHRPVYVAVYTPHPTERSLEVAGRFGSTVFETAYVTAAPLGVRTPSTIAFREGVPTDAPIAALVERFPTLSQWLDADPRRHDTHWFVQPLQSRGVPVGALTVAVPSPVDRTWQLRVELELAVHLSTAWLMTWSSHRRRSDPPAQHRPTGVVPLEVTERQRRVLQLVGEGFSNEQIARDLGFSEGTVRAELRVLSRLLGAQGRSDLFQRAQRAGYLPVEV